MPFGCSGYFTASTVYKFTMTNSLQIVATHLLYYKDPENFVRKLNIYEITTTSDAIIFMDILLKYTTYKVSLIKVNILIYRLTRSIK